MNITDYISYNEDTGEFIALRDRGVVKKGMLLGTKTFNGYLTLCFNRKHYLCHRLAFLLKEGYLPEEDVDHINGIRNDNRWCNLRKATRQQNMFNKTGNINKTLPRNVYLHTSGRFRVKMKVDGKTLHFGYYETVEEANAVANAVRKEHHKEFSKTL